RPAAAVVGTGPSDRRPGCKGQPPRMNASFSADIWSRMRKAFRLDLVAWLLALLTVAGAAAAPERSSVGSSGLATGPASAESGLLPAADLSAGERPVQVEKRLRRLDRAPPAWSGGDP